MTRSEFSPTSIQKTITSGHGVLRNSHILVRSAVKPKSITERGFSYIISIHSQNRDKYIFDMIITAVGSSQDLSSNIYEISKVRNASGKLTFLFPVGAKNVINEF